MKLKHLTVLLAAAALGLLLFVPAAQGASGPAYGLAGNYSTTAGCTGLDCPFPTYDWSGSAFCISHCAGVPSSATFTLTLTGSGAYPPSPCVSKRVAGTFSFYPSDPVYPADPLFVSLTGHSVDGKSYSLAGTVPASSPLYPTDPLHGTVTYPTDPTKPNTRNACLAGPVSWPSDPMFVSFGS